MGKTTVSAMEYGLKACPCCASNNVRVSHVFYDESRKNVQCLNCGLRTDFYDNVKDAINVWNKRGGIG